MSLEPPESVRTLQAALHTQAKRSPSYRFYSLYDKVCRRDVLTYAYQRCRQNAGAAGVDGQTFAAIESEGLDRWLDEVTHSLEDRTYQPNAIRRVYIPKSDGGRRPLGIGTIRDRVVQMAVVIVLGSIFEADLQPEQYGYRPGRSALDAVRQVQVWVNAGYRSVVDADLSGYFDSIPHRELLKSVARRVSDGSVLALVKAWLEAPVEEEDRRGHVSRTTPNKTARRGTPQGSPLSPLLSNVYFRRFVLGWHSAGHTSRFESQIVNYADDFVICCRGDADQALSAMWVMMSKLKLTVNESKTRVCRLPDESLDFLGYTIGRCYRVPSGKAYIGPRPSAKRVARVKQAIREMTGNPWGWLPESTQVARLNSLLTGWSNYFCVGSVSAAYRAVDHHVRERLRHWLCRKHRLGNRGIVRYPDRHLYEVLGLVQLMKRPRSVSCAKV